MRKTHSAIFPLLALVIPVVVFAESRDFKGLVSFIITGFLTPVTYLIMSLAIVFFLWNIAMVVKNSDNPEELEKFKSKAVWGIVAIAAMVSLWGLVNFITGSLNLDVTEEIVIPGLGTGSTDNENASEIAFP